MSLTTKIGECPPISDDQFAEISNDLWASGSVVLSYKTSIGLRVTYAPTVVQAHKATIRIRTLIPFAKGKEVCLESIDDKKAFRVQDCRSGPEGLYHVTLRTLHAQPTGAAE